MVIYNYFNGNYIESEKEVAKEIPLRICINKIEIATMLCSPGKLNALILGFLYLEGFIDSLDDVQMLHVCEEDGIANALISREVNSSPRKIFTSGCGKGITFSLDEDKYAPLSLDDKFNQDEIIYSMKNLYSQARCYQETGGMHASCLCKGFESLITAEDVGRHNTIDKIMGESLLLGILTKGKLLATTGRISSEMLLKGVRMQIPIMLSRTSPTELAVKLAKHLNITLIGYVRNTNFIVYTHNERIISKAPVMV